MNDKKNIDRLFQEKFKDFEIAPNDAVWNRISESLPKKKKKRRVVALWWQLGGVAAAIALLLTVGVSLFNTENSNKDLPIVKTDSTDTKNNHNNKTQSDKQNELNNVKFNKTKLVESDNNQEAINGGLVNDNDNISPKDKNTSRKLTTPNNFRSKAVVNNSTEQEKSKISQNRSTSISDKNNKTSVAANTKNSSQTEIINDDELNSAIKKTIENTKSAVTKNNSSKESEIPNTNTTEIKATEVDVTEQENAIVEKESIENAIAAQDEIDEKEKEDKQNRWSIAPNVAPVYFSSLGKGSSIDSQFNNNAKSSDINMSYGITGTYAISQKLKIRAGINRVNLSQTTSDVFAFTGGEFASRNTETQGNINARKGAGNVTLMSANMFDRNTTPEIFNDKIAGNVDQRFGFIEIPLELEYRLIDKKFGVNVIGGFSTFFLNQNEIYADIDGTSTLIGEASNINSTSFSANFGLGLDYNLSKQWNINLEPQFKYQINTFNNTSGDFRPFFIGVYTGLSFKF